MSFSLEELALINPDMAQAPEGFDYARAISGVRHIYARLQQMGIPDLHLDGGIQDATFHGAISIGQHGSIRFSNFRELTTITHEEKFPGDLLPRIVHLLEQNGYTYVPFSTFGEPLETCERTNGDVFNRLFDYV